MQKMAPPWERQERSFLLNVICAEGDGSLSVSGGEQILSNLADRSAVSVRLPVDVQNIHSYVLSVVCVCILITFLTIKHSWQKSNIFFFKKSSLFGVNLAGL